MRDLVIFAQFKNVKNIHEGVLLLLKVTLLHGCFTFLKLYNWYQTAQNIIYIEGYKTYLSIISPCTNRTGSCPIYQAIFPALPSWNLLVQRVFGNEVDSLLISRGFLETNQENKIHQAFTRSKLTI